MKSMLHHSHTHDECITPYKKQGFTIVELLIVIVIIGILAAIGIVSYVGVTQKATVAVLQSDLGNASKKLKMYYALYDSYPTALDTSNCPTTPVIDSNYCLSINNNNTIKYNGSVNAFSLVETNGTTYYMATNDTAPTVIDSTYWGLVGYWKFDEGSGTTIGDSSNGGVTGTISGSPVWSTGKSGNALTFDGATTYVNFGRSTSFNVTTFSVAFWYRVPVLSNKNYQMLFNFSNVASAKFDSSGSMWSMTPGRNMSVHTPTTNIWYHIVLTNDGSTYRSYINGVLAQSWSCSPGSWDSGYDSYLGGAGQFKGDIDNLRLYNRALGSAEINSLYNSNQ